MKRSPFRNPAASSPAGAGVALLLFFFAALFLFPAQAAAGWDPLIKRLVDDGFEETYIQELFARPEVKFDSSPMACKLNELLKISPSPRPAVFPVYNPRTVYKPLLREKTITQARSYLRENNDLLENVTAHSCVPKEIVVSILLVETRLGEYVGGSSAFNRLASMASSSDLEMIRGALPKKLVNTNNEDRARTICLNKSDWAYNELKALIEYAQMSDYDPLALPGSIYGAIGICQFMPSNIFPYGIDADRDGRIDLFAKADALASIANYLQEHGWKCGIDREGQLRVIFDYNRSSAYVNTVLAVAEKLKGDPPRRAAGKVKIKKAKTAKSKKIKA
ncbi:MAG TPA: lytic murein transglycosylase [Thermodesulfobacteriota bacterium]|nr:lytic murein transglycosylase [Thermodesulfobacteriota bacterium]